MAKKEEQIDEDIKCLAQFEGKSSRVVITDFDCKLFEKHDNPPLFIIGFTGVGLVGTIVVNELIQQLKMKQIGYVLSEDLPPITLFYEGILQHPFRLYYSKEYNIIVSICEVPFNPGSYIDLSRTLMDWALHHEIQDVIVLQGMADESYQLSDKKPPVYAAAEKEILDKILAQSGVIKPPSGVLLGAEAAMLNECLNNKLNGAVFLTPANPKYPNPEGAGIILEKIAEIYKFPIKLDTLLKQSAEIKQKLSELQQHTNEVHSQGPLKPFRDLYT